MVIGILQFELSIPGAFSLKDKRRVVRSLKDRLHREHLVSVAEVDALEIWNVAVMGLAIVSRDSVYTHSVLDRVLDKLRSLPEATLGEYSREVLDSNQLPTGMEADDGTPLWTPDEKRDPESGSGADGQESRTEEDT